MTRPWTRPTLTLLLLVGAATAISPPSPVAANDGDNPPPGGCDSLVDCLTDTVPVPPGPCGGILQIVESCRCLTRVGACGIEVPDPCDDVGDCGCIIPEHVNSPDDVRVCGFSVNPCDWLAGTGSTNACACVNVPTTTTFGRAPSGSGSCGIALPSGPGDGRPDPCDGLPEETCGCISISSTIPGVALSTVPDYVCGVPTNPCALVGTGTLADGCGCVEMNGPQRLSLVGLFAATTITSTGIIPTSICGFPTDPCATSAGAVACECVAQIEREVLQGGGGGETPAILAFQRIVTPPAFCIPVGGKMPVCGEYVSDLDPTISGILYWAENTPKQLQHCLATQYCGQSTLFPETIMDPPQYGQTVCCPSQYAQEDYYKVIDSVGGPNYREWVLQLVYYAPGDSVDHRIGWNNQLPETKKATTQYLRTGQNLQSTWIPPYTYISQAGQSRLCGDFHDTHCVSPCVFDVEGHFGGLDITTSYAHTTAYSHATSWSVTAAGEENWSIQLDNVGIGGSRSLTVGYGETNTWSWSDGVEQTWHSTEQIYLGRGFTA